MGDNARKCAEERFNREITYIELTNAVFDMLDKNKEA